MGAVPVSVSQYFNVSSMSSKLDGAYRSPVWSGNDKILRIECTITKRWSHECKDIYPTRLHVPQGTGGLALIHINHPKVLSGETTVILLAFQLWSQMSKTQMQWNTFLFYVNHWDNPTYYTGGHSDGTGKSSHCSHVGNTTSATFDCPMPQAHGHQIHHLSWWHKLRPMGWQAHQEIQETLFFPVRSDHVVDPWDLVFNT